MKMSLYSIIFAVDEGKRMKSKIAKPLQPVAGKALIEWVADTSTEAGAKENIVVIGHMAEEVKEYLGDTCTYIYNHEQQSTGNALMQGIKAISDNSGTVMVLYGDSPLITSDTLKDVMAEHSAENRAATVITFTSEEAIGYGKIICENGKITKIIEQEDVSESNKKVCECNSGMYFFDIQKLVEALKKIENNNVKGEYYITDVIEVLVSMNEKVGTYHTALEQTLSVNDKVQL
ncbi:MAG: NTP transferase domain-containing protein, partial [Oscillospiraceae bacterium]